jgi:FOG: Ankyrin repeat
MTWRKSTLVKDHPEIASFLEFILEDNFDSISRLLKNFPHLAAEPFIFGATRQCSADYFVDELTHYIYSGDTALHIASMAHCKEVVELLVEKGGDIHARNRRGAQPLHYASDGSPNAATWNPKRQETTVAKLIKLGADPNALDKSGVAPIHRAVRQRCTGAVRGLIAGGADVNLKNKSGTTPFKLAELTTGKGGSGTDEAKREQKKIIQLLTAAGAR